MTNPNTENATTENTSAEAPAKPKSGAWSCPSDIRRRNLKRDAVTFQVWTIPAPGGKHGAMVRRVEAGKNARAIQIVRPDELAKIIKSIDDFKPDFEKRPVEALCAALADAFAPQQEGLSAGKASSAARAVLVEDIAARPLTAKAIKSWAA